MKKITLLFTMLLLVTFSWQANAQFPEGFETAVPPAGWASFIGTNGEGTGYDWETSATAASGSAAAYVRYEGVANSAEDWLVTPQFTPSVGASILTFMQRQGFASDYSTVYTVRVSILASQTTHADFTTVDTQAETDFNTIYTAHNVDLSAYIGTPIYVAFVMEQNDGDNWYIDDVNMIADASPPNCAENPAPADLATDVTVTGGNVTIAWDAPSTGDAATAYNVWWGTTSGALTDLGSISVTTIDITGSDYSTTYYWSIVPSNVGGSATGCAEWSFTTEDAPLGATCDAPLVVSTLPYNTSDDTANYADDYTGSPGATGCGTTSSYLNGDDVVYAYTATADASINFALSSIGSAYSGMFVYTDCADIGTACIAGQGNGSSTVAYDYDVDVTNGTTYYIVISTWAAPQSTTYTLDITENTCTNPTATYTVVDDCASNGGFLIDVDVTDLGSATSVTISDNQSSTPVSVSTTGVVQFGDYVNTTDVVITITNDQDGSCVITSSALTQAVCPAANDNFAGAIPITPSTEGTGCASYTFSYTASGTSDSGMNDTCAGLNTGLDRFFTWTATSDGLIWNDGAGGPGIAIWDATGTTVIDCNTTNAAADTVLSGWTIGDALVIQIYDFQGSTSDIDFCLEEYTLPTVPDCATNNFPADLATSVASECGGNLDLTWSAAGTGATPDSYDVYFGTSTSPSFVGNTTSLTYEVSVSASTTYYYMIVPKSGANDAVGCAELSFTTGTTSTDGGSGGVVNEYFFANNNFAGGTPASAYSYNDPVAAGHTEVAATTAGSLDDGYVTVPLPFTYRYYGVDYTEAHMGTNGYLSFGSGYTVTGGSTDLGSTSDPDNMIAAAMMDLDDMSDGKMYFGAIDSTTYAFTWFHYHDYSDASEWITMQLLIQANSNPTENGSFEIRYNETESSVSIPDFLSDAVIGCEDVNANVATEYATYREDGVGGPMFCSPLVLGFGSSSSSVVLSVEDISSIEGFSMYPNPVNDILRFNAQDNIEAISIYNLLGQEVLARTPNTAQSEVSMSNLPTGVYVVKVKVGEQLGTYKVVKE